MGRRRGVPPGDSRRFYDWLYRASEDMLAAKILMENDHLCYKSSAFHCQQAIEKALKAYILLCTGKLMDGHNLAWLCRQAMKEDEDFRLWMKKVSVLNHCYIETRNPPDIPFDVTYDQLKDAYRTAVELFRFICSQVDEEMEERYGAFPHAGAASGRVGEEKE